MSSEPILSPAGVWLEYKRARRRFFTYRTQATVIQKVTLATGFAALTGVAAQLRIPLPFTPVPVTLQTFAVLLTGVALGARWGASSQALYAGLGAAGVPWFAGMAGGLGTIVGPTGGYIVGFVLAAGFIGYVTDTYPWSRRVHVLTGLFVVANFGIIYGVGLPWLFGWLTLIKGATPSIMDVLTMGLFPFVPGDIVKLVAAAGIGQAITPGHSFGPDAQPQSQERDEG